MSIFLQPLRQMFCLAPDCRREGTHRGMCPTHYARQKKTGTLKCQPWRKLKPEDIPVILSLLASGMGQREVGVKFGVSRSNISGIANGLKWKRECQLARHAS